MKRKEVIPDGKGQACRKACDRAEICRRATLYAEDGGKVRVPAEKVEGIAESSMSNVVRIADRAPHLAGPARCVECGAEWEAVGPVGMIVLDCPECGAQKGARLAFVEKDGPHWTCHCGNALFLITEAGAYCPNCGIDQTGPLPDLPSPEKCKHLCDDGWCEIPAMKKVVGIASILVSHVRSANGKVQGAPLTSSSSRVIQRLFAQLENSLRDWSWH